MVADTRRVIAGVSGSVRSLAALRAGAAEARSAGAELLPVLAWTPVGGEMAYLPVLAVPAPEMIRELRSRHHWRPEDFAWPALAALRGWVTFAASGLARTVAQMGHPDLHSHEGAESIAILRAADGDAAGGVSCAAFTAPISSTAV